MIQRVSGFLLFLLLAFGSLWAQKDQSEIVREQLIYSFWELEAKVFGLPDSTRQLAVASVDKALEQMFRDYLYKKEEPAFLRREFPLIARAIKGWDEAFRKQMSFKQFCLAVSQGLGASYADLPGKKNRMEDHAAFEKEIVLWLGDFLKNTSRYSERVYAYYYTKGPNKPEKLENIETSLHTLLTGRKGNKELRRYNCESFSKAMVLLAAQFGLRPDVVSIITVQKDPKGKSVNYSIIENDVYKRIGHVCNLIALSNGSRFYYDQGIAMKHPNEHKLVVSYDRKGGQYEFNSSIDPAWDKVPSIGGQTIDDLHDIIVLDQYLNRVESFILQSTGQLFTDPKQTQQKKALFIEVRDEMKKDSFDHIRVIGTDVVKEKAKSILYELDFQIQQLDEATAKLKEQDKANRIIEEYNKSIDAYNLHNQRYRQLVVKFRNNIPALKLAIAPLKEECISQRDRLVSLKNAISKPVRSAEGNEIRFESIVDQYNALIANMDQVLKLPKDIKFLNVK